MPRNVSDIYYIPPGTEGFPDTTIESEKYNNYIHDVETDLNRPRPIIAGGTGGTSIEEALAALEAEKASQEVTNYDTHLWQPGSFYSATGATGAPIAGHAFTGWVTSSDPLADPPTNLNVVVYARDQSDTVAPGKLYIREKKAGVWGSWGSDGIYVSATPPLNAPRNSLWWSSTDGLLYVRFDDGNTTQWVIACPQPDTSMYAFLNSPIFTGDPQAPTPLPGDNDKSIATTEFVKKALDDAGAILAPQINAAVRYDITQALTDTQAAQARTNIKAASFQAVAFSGMQINGGMDVDQANNGAVVNFATGAVSKYSIDGFYVKKTGTNVFTMQQITSTIPGYNKSLSLSVFTAQPTIGSDTILIDNMIEGYRFTSAQWGTAAAQPITVGFWVKSSVAGSLKVRAVNALSTLSSDGSVTITTANVAQWVTCVLPGVTTGTWEKTTGVGARLSLTVAGTGSINIAANNGNSFEITGLVVFLGSEVPPADRSTYLMRPFPLEETICMRYYEKLGGAGITGTTITVAGSYSYVTWQFKGKKRVTPTVTLGAGSIITASNGAGPDNYTVFKDGGPTFLAAGTFADARLV